MYPSISISRKFTITLRCVERPTPVAPSVVLKPCDTDIVPMTIPKMPALKSPTKRSFVSAIESALDMYCLKSTLSCVDPTMPPPSVPMTEQ